MVTTPQQPSSKRRRPQARQEPAPSIAYIMAMKDRALSESEAIREHWAEITAVRNGTYPVPIPDEFAGEKTRKIRTRRCADTIRRVTSTVTRNFPTVVCPPAGPSGAQQDASTRREEFLNAGLQAMDSANMPERTFEQGMDYSVALGVGWWKLLYVKDKWFGEPTARSVFDKKVTDLTVEEMDDLKARREEFKKGKMPFDWGAPDPSTVWGFYLDRELVEVVEITERPVNQLARKYGARYVRDADGGHLEPEQVGQPFQEGEAPTASGETIVFVEHWTKQWCSYVAGNTVLQQFKHNYGRVPYFPFLGLSNYTNKPGARGESVVEHVLDLEKELDALLSMKHQNSIFNAFPMGVIEAKDPNAMPFANGPEGGAEGQTGPDIAYESGKFKVSVPGWEFNWKPGPDTGRDLNEQILYLDGKLAQVVPDVLKGIASGTDQPGYAIYQLATAARLVYDPLCANAGVALEAMLDLWQYLIEFRVKEPVFVLAETGQGDVKTRKWLSIGPKELKGYYKNTVNLAALLPSNRQMEVQMGLALYQANAITWKTLLEEYVHKPDPEREMRAKMREQAIYDPNSLLFKWAMEEALKEAGLDRILKQKQEEAALAAVPEPIGVQEEMMLAEQEAMLQQGAAGQVEAPGMQTIPPPMGPPPPATAGAAPGVGGVAGPNGGLVAGAPRMPNTQMAPGGGI